MQYRKAWNGVIALLSPQGMSWNEMMATVLHLFLVQIYSVDMQYNTLVEQQ